MEPRIKILEDKKLIGTRLKMSLEMDKTAQLWGGFIPRIKEIKKRFRTDKISMQIYNSSYFTSFDAVNVFEKWATVEVTDFKEVPEEMEVFILKGGEYAVFDYKGVK